MSYTFLYGVCVLCKEHTNNGFTLYNWPSFSFVAIIRWFFFLELQPKSNHKCLIHLFLVKLTSIAVISPCLFATAVCPPYLFHHLQRGAVLHEFWFVNVLRFYSFSFRWIAWFLLRSGFCDRKKRQKAW